MQIGNPTKRSGLGDEYGSQDKYAIYYDAAYSG